MRKTDKKMKRSRIDMENSQLSKSREQGRSDIRNERGMKYFSP